MNDYTEVTFTVDLQAALLRTPGLMGWGNMLGLSNTRIWNLVAALAEMLPKPTYVSTPDVFECDPLKDVIGFVIDDMHVIADPVALASFEEGAIEQAAYLKTIAPVVIKEATLLTLAYNNHAGVFLLRGLPR